MAKKTGKILVVDDNAGIRSALKILLPLRFEEVETLSSPNVLTSRLADFRPDTVLLDMNFHTDINTGNEGLFWLSEIKRISPETEVVLFTAYADIALAVEGMKRGAFDFIVKPWDNERLVGILRSACGSKGKRQTEQDEESPNAGNMYWGTGHSMQELRHTAEKVAPTDASVLITGENGTGKDMLAKEMHRLSERRQGPMICVDAGALPETLFESELFGHVKGAFTDAHSDHAGKFEQACGGTLFLDEIGNIPLHLQAKLLRVLQDRAVTRVGGTKPVPVDIRLICATNRNLDKMVRDGQFREDLYYRINTVHLHLPALRERPDEIEPLAKMFAEKYSARYRRDISGLSEAAVNVLRSHRWSGNIRELQNCIEKAVILSERKTLEKDDIRLTVPQEETTAADGGESLEKAEERAVRAAVERFRGNLSLVAKSLGISRPTLYAKLKKYNI